MDPVSERLKGLAGQAFALVRQMIAEGLLLGHTLTLAHVLSDAACFMASSAGDLPLAARYTTMLREHTTLHALSVWRTKTDASQWDRPAKQ